MNKTDSNRNAMLKATGHVFTKYTTDIAGNAILKSCVEEYMTRNNQIGEVLQIQQGKITGVAEQKQKEEMEMIDETVRVAGCIYVFAIDHSNFDLAARVNINNSTLVHVNESKLVAQCRNIYTLLRDNLAGLAQYGITEADAVKLDKEITDFEQLVAKPRTQIVTRSEANGRIKQLIRVQMDLLNQKIDKLMLQFKTSKPVFYNEYKSARYIVNMGIRHESDETGNDDQTDTAA
jgi:hypothetical protein